MHLNRRPDNFSTLTHVSNVYMGHRLDFGSTCQRARITGVWGYMSKWVGSVGLTWAARGTTWFSPLEHDLTCCPPDPCLPGPITVPCWVLGAARRTRPDIERFYFFHIFS
jgi:hypothetical protein